MCEIKADKNLQRGEKFIEQFEFKCFFELTTQGVISLSKSK